MTDPKKDLKRVPEAEFARMVRASRPRKGNEIDLAFLNWAESKIRFGGPKNIKMCCYKLLVFLSGNQRGEGPELDSDCYAELSEMAADPQQKIQSELESIEDENQQLRKELEDKESENKRLRQELETNQASPKTNQEASNKADEKADIGGKKNQEQK